MTVAEVVVGATPGEHPAHCPRLHLHQGGQQLRKVSLDDILFIEVEGKYSALQVRDRKYNVKASLKDLLHKLPSDVLCV